MCGIAAIYSNDQNILGKIDKIIKKINYRGPDDMGSLQLNKNFSVGSCRLSIFDVSEKGKMPMKILLIIIQLFTMVKSIIFLR